MRGKNIKCKVKVCFFAGRWTSHYFDCKIFQEIENKPNCIFLIWFDPWLVLKDQVLSRGLHLSSLLTHFSLFLFTLFCHLMCISLNITIYLDWVQCIDSSINLQWFDEESIESSLLFGNLNLLISKKTDIQISSSLSHSRISWHSNTGHSKQHHCCLTAFAVNFRLWLAWIFVG